LRRIGNPGENQYIDVRCSGAQKRLRTALGGRARG
jgi:hypothetical protein